MKTYCLLTAVLCLSMILMPLVFIAEGKTDNQLKNNISAAEQISVLQSISGRVVETDMKQYIIGAVAAEMPASYSAEALKAQAVACYSYAKWLRENADNPKTDENYDISDNSSVHQGYLTDEQMKEKWGDKYESYKEKIDSAVSAVLGECLMYEGEPIMAAFHAISPGRTLSSQAVWGEALPYLQSVNAPGDTLSPDYDSVAEFTSQELIKLCSLKDTAGNLIKNITADDNGYVTKITVGEKSYSGNEFYSLLKLKSPVFTAEYKEDKYVFSVIGYGHGVGMSQYSADYMARQGYAYDEILKHFYKNAYIDKVI